MSLGFKRLNNMGHILHAITPLPSAPRQPPAKSTH